MQPTTVAARGAAALVAAVAGAASYEHIASVARSAGERPWVAFALPLAIDGLIVVGVAALLEDRRAGRVPRWSARLAVAAGVLATLAANIASAEPTTTARLVAVAAPVAFLLAVEVLTRSGRPVAVAAPTAPTMVAGPATGEAVPREAPPATAAVPEVPEVPAEPASGRAASSVRRRPEETRRLYAELRAEQPGLKQLEYAALLGITPKALRNALNGSAPEPAAAG